MRLFIGIPIPLHPGLIRAGANLEGCHQGVKRVPPQNWHITLRFFGEMEDAGPAVSAMKQAVKGVARFSLTVRGVGAFPEARRARVVWAGVESETIQFLESRIGEKTAKLGSPPEQRRFKPHLTLARIQPGCDVTDWVEQYRQKRFFRIMVNEVVLYRSKPGSEGPVYLPLTVIPLQNRASPDGRVPGI